MYSGTVAVAREASRRGIPSIAVSQAFDDTPIKFKEAGKFVRSFVRDILQKKPAPGALLNVNIPIGSVRGVKITRQGASSYFPHFNVLDTLETSNDNPHPDEHIKMKRELVFDYQAVANHYISITPLQRDQTDYVAARSLKEEFPQTFRGRRLSRMGLIG